MIICMLHLRFPLIWIWFLLCICVCFCYIRVLQTIDQAMVAFVDDLNNWPYVYVRVFGQFCISFISLKLRCYDHGLGFKSKWSTHKHSPWQLHTSKVHTMHKTICGTICMIKVFVCCKFWVFQFLPSLFLDCWKLGMLHNPTHVLAYKLDQN
jgi:hypothetical protein